MANKEVAGQINVVLGKSSPKMAHVKTAQRTLDQMIRYAYRTLVMRMNASNWRADALNVLGFQGQMMPRMHVSQTVVIITNILRQMVDVKSVTITPELTPMGPAVFKIPATREKFSKRMGHVNRAHSIQKHRPISNVDQMIAQTGKL